MSPMQDPLGVDLPRDLDLAQLLDPDHHHQPNHEAVLRQEAKSPAVEATLIEEVSKFIL